MLELLADPVLAVLVAGFASPIQRYLGVPDPRYYLSIERCGDAIGYSSLPPAMYAFQLRSNGDLWETTFGKTYSLPQPIYSIITTTQRLVMIFADGTVGHSSHSDPMTFKIIRLHSRAISVQVGNKGTIIIEMEDGSLANPEIQPYYTPVTTMDYSSLYPSVIIAYNLDYETLIPPA